jgi:hypothetical protein
MNTNPHTGANDMNTNTQKYRNAKMILFLSDARGIYIPRDFAQEIVRNTLTGVSAEDLDYLAAGPDGEHYWDVWSDVCDRAVITDPTDGTEYNIVQDGDCWLVERGAEHIESLPSADTEDCDQMYVVEVES